MFSNLPHRLTLVACALGLFMGPATPAPAAETLTFTLHFDRTNGTFRALHGINKGPIAAGGTINLLEKHRDLGIPHIRLHDCQWPHPDVVDVHSIFRNPAADPDHPASYDFALTDEYLAAVHATGASMVYRLGESIEHMETKRFVHPPADPEQWAAVCIGIIRHFNEGWANGFRYGIPYWEIWNEPENRPAMWTGSDEEFLHLYSVAAKTIKDRFPHLKVGGPGLGHTGTVANGEYEPAAFLRRFLQHCRTHSVPLDFFSWHCYTDDADELVTRAKGVRKFLNLEGFSATESHLNEWNYLPDNSWASFSRSASPASRRDFYRRAQGSEGAAFVLASLIKLQNAPVDVCNFYHGELGGFGLFDNFGGETDVFQAFKLFNDLLQTTPLPLHSTGGKESALAITAGRDAGGNLASVLLANPADQPYSVQLRIESLPTGLREGLMTSISPSGIQSSEVQIHPDEFSLPLDPHSLSILRLGPRNFDGAKQ